jgi:hypothetical protein
MTTIDFTISDKGYKDSAENARGICKVRLDKESKLYYTKGIKGRGGRGLGRFHEITELFFDSNSRVFIGFKAKVGNSRMAFFYQYAVIGRLEGSDY